MKRYILILVVFFSFLGVVLAQNHTITIQVITEDELEEHLGSVYLTHSANEQQYRLDNHRQINLEVQIGEIIVFQSEYFEFHRVQIDPKHIQQKFLQVYLIPKPIELQEADLSFQLTGNLEKDAKNAKFKDSKTELYQSLGIEEKDVPPPNPNGPKASTGFTPLALVGAITGYNKRQKKKYEYDDRLNKIETVKNYLDEEYLLKELKLPKHKLDEFFSFVFDSTEIYKFVSSNQYLKAKEIIDQYSKIYLDRLNKKTHE